MALVLASLSASFIRLRISMRHSVTLKVKITKPRMVTKGMAAKRQSKRYQRMPQARRISISVGITEKAVKNSRNSMPLVPRSMARLRPPVWRSRWKRSDSACMWRKVASATRRTAFCATRENSASRSSPKASAETRTRP